MLLLAESQDKNLNQIVPICSHQNRLCYKQASIAILFDLRKSVELELQFLL
jgi:hypothetical protein